jgi:hypothetical protein
MKQRILISLEPEQMHYVKMKAFQENISISEVIRRTLDAMEKEQGKKTKKEKKKGKAQSILDSVRQFHKHHPDAFKDAPRDLSMRVDEIVYGT